MRGREPLVVWLLLAAVAAAILVTYARLPARELYHVSGSGLGGGASRALVYLDFPAALIAIAIVAVSFEALAGSGRRTAAIAAVALCCAVFWPGVVDQANLDARWINSVAAAGVLLAALLTAGVVLRRDSPTRWDGLRVALAALALLAAPEWVAADLGFFLDGVPLLGRLYQSGPYSPQSPTVPAVHHGHHHGLDGVLLVLSSLLLSRGLSAIGAGLLRRATAAYLALMLAYGFGNVANDFWGEQVVKRGWTAWVLPSVLQPRPTWSWLCVAGAAVLVFAVWYDREGPQPDAPAAARS
jgi:hypothetical protein